MSSIGLFLRIADFMKIYNLTYYGAVQRYNLIKDALGKTKKQLISYNELASYEGVNVTEITKHLTQ